MHHCEVLPRGEYIATGACAFGKTGHTGMMAMMTCLLILAFAVYAVAIYVGHGHIGGRRGDGVIVAIFRGRNCDG